MKGTCVIAWLFSSLGCWGLAQPDADAVQCQRAEHPVVSYKEIGPWLREFRAKDAVDFSQLTFDPGQKELVVGARNYLFRLQLEDLSLIQAVEWHCDEVTKKACYSKGKSEEECQNYIRVLLVGGDRLFTCGTNAFTPVCTNRTLSNLTEVHDQISGMARCPYSPQHNSTALLTAGGELYAATAMDFPGRDPAIYRSLGVLPPLRTAQYNSKWLNDYGTIKKVRAPLTETSGSCLLEEIELLPRRQREPIRSLLILHSQSALFVGLREHVAKVPLRRCQFHSTRSACIGAQDPYCGWDVAMKKCTSLEESLSMTQWEQTISACPTRNLTVDGRFGAWSPWAPCTHADGSAVGTCLCRSRSCDSPAPRCGGWQCEGPRMEIANCSRNGGWTPWTTWSPCSTTCGIGFQVRQRACSNPTPRHGGRVCVGQNREERYCNEHLLCPPHVFWMGWGPWERCTAQCGGGIQARRRTCENGPDCVGCNVEYQPCNTTPCPELKKTTPWTPWTPVNISDNGGHYEQRFRYTCKARLPDPNLLEVGRQRIEMRYCSSDGTSGCSTDGLSGDFLRAGRYSAHTVNGAWSAWTPWSQCSRDCSRGVRNRKRACNNPEPKHGGAPCLGPALEYQECNILPCPVDGMWSCWSPWSKCSATCGSGHYMRTRSCTNPAPAYGGDICLGLHTEEALCNTQPCPESWSEWSHWTECDMSGVQVRARQCTLLFPVGSQCSGNTTESRPCVFDSNLIPEVSVARSSSVDEKRCGEFNMFHMVAVGLSSSILGCLLTLLVYTYCQRYQQQAHDATVIHPVAPAPLNTSITNHINKLDKYDSVEAIKAFNKNNLILEERNKYFNPHLTGKTYSNAYFTDLNNYDEY
uniref:Semaphorin 5A n=1 Tax=Rousettus aegyptiacus TaxID=9407 RepID=A0A7J8F4P2_ROUAE|nr:semaphorin 5A [Rousettus aegyptiacus]